MKFRFVVLIYLLMQFPSLHACSCSGSPTTFVNSIGNVILEVTYLRSEEMYFGEEAFPYKNKVSVLRVNNVIKGVCTADTIFVLEGMGSMCARELPEKTSGQKYILTGELNKVAEIFEVKENTNSEKLMLGLNLCAENYLFLNGDMVQGNVTTNPIARKAKWMNFLFKFNKKRYNKLANRSPQPNEYLDKMQEISLVRFYRILFLRCSISAT